MSIIYNAKKPQSTWVTIRDRGFRLTTANLNIPEKTLDDLMGFTEYKSVPLEFSYDWNSLTGCYEIGKTSAVPPFTRICLDLIRSPATESVPAKRCYKNGTCESIYLIAEPKNQESASDDFIPEGDS